MVNQPSLEIIAPTIEEALARGLDELGVTADAVTMEVLDPGSRGFLGFGARQVRIRLTLKPPEETVLGQIQRPAQEDAPAPSADEPVSPSAPAPQEAPALPQESTPDIINQVREVVENLLHHMDIRYQKVRVYTNENAPEVVHVDIEGRDMSILIGRRAEVLNAFQYIVALIIGKRLERWVQVVVDVQGYRKRREKALRQLAHRMADQAVKTGRRQFLEPMPANERRIVHLALRDRTDIETLSIGEEPYRKVTISPRN